MVREIITPLEPSYTLRLPEEMVGKTVEVIAFEIANEVQAGEKDDKEERLRRIRAITHKSLVDLSNFTFNRDDANNYEE
jgi:hypothetical protein